jgi:hypothetical protein
MNPVNGHANGSRDGEDHAGGQSDLLLTPAATPAQYTPEQIKQMVARLEVPFDPSVIEWRVTRTTKSTGNGTMRGQVIPYADQRAYTDRLNEFFTPAGWTRRYIVHSSANFERSKDQKTVAKVFVTCNLTIYSIGAHSATGEEWTDDENAGTSAEAQAFKRACSCFGLGRYLYYFTGIWVDLDDHKRPKTKPSLAGWATPEGWLQGLRPHSRDLKQGSQPATRSTERGRNQQRQSPGQAERLSVDIIRQVEAMAQPLGKALYRGLLKSVAKVWNPADIKDRRVLERLLTHMQAAERGLNRLEAAYLHTGAEPLAEIQHSLGITDMDKINNLEVLEKIVVALEAEAKNRSHGS